MSWTQLECTGKDDKKQTFYYKSEQETRHGEIEWSYMVSKIEEMDREGTFEAAVQRLNETTVMIIMMTHHGNESYTGKGIPDALIPAIAGDLDSDVVSSSDQDLNNAEYRTGDAEKMWKRLSKKGIARYDKKEGRYVHKR